MSSCEKNKNGCYKASNYSVIQTLSDCCGMLSMTCERVWLLSCKSIQIKLDCTWRACLQQLMTLSNMWPQLTSLTHVTASSWLSKSRSEEEASTCKPNTELATLRLGGTSGTTCHSLCVTPSHIRARHSARICRASLYSFYLKPAHYKQSALPTAFSRLDLLLATAQVQEPQAYNSKRWCPSLSQIM